MLKGAKTKTQLKNNVYKVIKWSIHPLIFLLLLHGQVFRGKPTHPSPQQTLSSSSRQFQGILRRLQQLYSELSDKQAPHEFSHLMEEVNFSCSYPGFCCIVHSPYLMTIREGWNVDGPVNWGVCLSPQLLHHNRLENPPITRSQSVDSSSVFSQHHS